MWTMIPSLQLIVDVLSPAFTHPSLVTSGQLLLGWIMCLGHHTLLRVSHNAHPNAIPDLSQRHGLDTCYNFFERAAWTPVDMAKQVGILLLTHLKILGRITLLVDDTLIHKRGKRVWGLGWFRDAVASTKKRVATASGHNWVVVAVAYCSPFSDAPILAFPLLARLHLPGKGQPSCAALVNEMLAEILSWYPGREFTLVGDGAYACKELLKNLDPRVEFVGRMRGDAAVYDPQVPTVPTGKGGRKPSKGPRLPGPKAAAALADQKATPKDGWLWQAVAVVVYGCSRSLDVVAYEVVWPTVLGPRPIRVVVVRDPSGRMRDCYLFTTDRQASAAWVVTQFAWRWSIEVMFRASKQVMDIEAPQQRSKESVEKLAPWVWAMQSVIMVWYLTAGNETEEALDLRKRMGEWSSEWSLRHMVQVLRSVILNMTINPMSSNNEQLEIMVKTLKNWANLAA